MSPLRTAEFILHWPIKIRLKRHLSRQNGQIGRTKKTTTTVSGPSEIFVSARVCQPFGARVYRIIIRTRHGEQDARRVHGGRGKINRACECRSSCTRGTSRRTRWARRRYTRVFRTAIRRRALARTHTRAYMPSSPGRHGHGRREAGDQVAAGQEVHHRSVRVRDLQGAERRETTDPRYRPGHRMPAGSVADSRRRGRGKL